MKKIVIFHICALPELYVKQNQSYLRLDPPPGKIFWIRACYILISNSKISLFLVCKTFASSFQKQQKCNIYRLSRVAGIVLSRYIYFCLESTVREQVTVQFRYIICLTA